MSDVYDIWLYPLQDWWRAVNEMMSTGRQMGKYHFSPCAGLEATGHASCEKFGLRTNQQSEWLLC